jgi:putative cell wall-binding protein
MKVLLALIGISILALISLQSASAQSKNTTQFQVSTVSVYLDENFAIKKLVNTTKTVQSIDEALAITNAGLANSKGGSTMIIANNSTQLVDNSIANDVFEKILRSKVDSDNPPQILGIHGVWVYLGGGDSYHIQVGAQ